MSAERKHISDLRSGGGVGSVAPSPGRSTIQLLSLISSSDSFKPRDWYQPAVGRGILSPWTYSGKYLLATGRCLQSYAAPLEEDSPRQMEGAVIPPLNLQRPFGIHHLLTPLDIYDLLM